MMNRLAFSFTVPTVLHSNKTSLFPTPRNACNRHGSHGIYLLNTDAHQSFWAMTATTGRKGEETEKIENETAENMTLHFISKTVSVDGRPSDELAQHIEEILGGEGEPVRWAIVETNAEKQTCRVDAVVSRNN